jgi:Tfp pilus assembly protein PilN
MKRIPVNLASHPIEQRQWLRRVKRLSLGAAAILTAAHLLFAWFLLGQPIEAVPTEDVLQPLRAWSAEVEEATAAANPQQAGNLAVSVALSNALIDQRVFPWGSLFSALEQIMPDDVRLEIIQPVATVDGVRVTMTAASASGDSLLDFLSALEGRSEFYAVYPGRQSLGLDGDLRLSVEALARVVATAPGAAEEQRP